MTKRRTKKRTDEFDNDFACLLLVALARRLGGDVAVSEDEVKSCQSYSLSWIAPIEGEDSGHVVVHDTSDPLN